MIIKLKLNDYCVFIVLLGEKGHNIISVYNHWLVYRSIRAIKWRLINETAIRGKGMNAARPEHFHSVTFSRSGTKLLILSSPADLFLLVGALLELWCQRDYSPPQHSHSPGCQQKCVWCLASQCQDPQRVCANVHRNGRKNQAGLCQSA